MTLDEFKHMNISYPFLTYLKFNDSDIIGIIQNSDNQLVSIYSYNLLTTNSRKIKFLELGGLWWENSNRHMPIDIFLRQDFDQFKSILKCYTSKNINNIIGHVVSIEENFQKRIKKRRIQLVRNMGN